MASTFWSDLDRAQAYLDFCATRLLDPDDPEVLAWWLGEAAYVDGYRHALRGRALVYGP